MKKFAYIFFSLVFIFFAAPVSGQEYLQIVSLESDNGTYGTFTSAGMGEKKKDVEENAVKSLFYTLFFQGVEGVADSKPLVAKPNVSYTNSFFNDMARYSTYVVEVKEADKTKKVGNNFQGTMRIKIRLRQLINDVRKNTHYDEMMAEQQEQSKVKLPNPTIIVVPYKKEGESYQAILENNYDIRIAVSAVQRGFENCGIKTIDLQARLDRAKRNAQYEENAGTADSNDKQLLESSGADVYVTVDLLKDVTEQDARVSLIMKAYETASGTIWASQDGWTNRFRTNDTDVLCSYAVKDNLPGFLEQIVNNFSQPSRASLQVALSGTSYNSITDARGNDGRRVMDVIQDWLDRNSNKGEYHLQGIVDEKAIFDYVILPLMDENGYKMTPDKFAGRLRDELEKQGIYSSHRAEGNTIFLTLEL